MRVLLDVDEVMLDALGFLLLNLRVDPKTIQGNGWDIWAALEMQGYEFDTLVKNVSWWQNVPEIEGALTGVQALRELERVEVVFVTALYVGFPGWLYERARRLQMGFGAKDTEIVITGNKSLVEGDVFVDDKAEAVRSWQAAHPKGRGLLFDALNNQEVTDLPRVKGWDALLPLLTQWHQEGLAQAVQE